MAKTDDRPRAPPAEKTTPAPAPSPSTEETNSSSPAASEDDAKTSETTAQDPPEGTTGDDRLATVPSVAGAAGIGDDLYPPVEAPPAPEEGVAPVEEVAGAVAQRLPLNLPDVAGLDDADAAAVLDNEFLSLLPPSVLPRINRLKSLNERREEILDEYRVERAALELKFSKMMAPLFEERRGVVNGEMDETIEKEEKENSDASGGERATEDVGEEEGAVEAGDNIKGIPQFWACAMGHVDVIAELITEADVDCLDHLTDITCADFPDGLGFELAFHFSPNVFFTNAILTKRYEVPNLLTEDEPILKNVTGTTIHWKKGRSLTFREVVKKQRKKGGRGAGQIRTIKKRERSESFFHFFTPPRMPAASEVMDEEEADAVEEAFDHDYDVAQSIRGHLIPRAVVWFTGEAMLEDYSVGDDEEEDDGDEEGDSDGDNGGGGAVQGGAQQQFTFNPNGGNNPFPPPAAGEGENPECKQN